MSTNCDLPPHLRLQSLEFLIESAHELEVTPLVKYTALSLFADRFFRSFSRFVGQKNQRNLLLQSITESNLQLFALISLWISSKMHDSRPLSVKTLKILSHKTIKEQHFTTRDFLEAEVVFLQVLNYEIGAGNIVFKFLEDLLDQFREVAKVGELVKFEACMDIMDLLYEKEETSILYSSPYSLAASILVASYVITVPNRRWKFPVLAWVKFATSFKEEDIVEIVRDILKHVFEPIDKRCKVMEEKTFF
ncbi:cyclin-J18 [Mercurialis annua]|uniref:cyclin-J18 n=1 Tax=Mercurialis annua TaxID=3986 RepID=UPI00215FA6BD|nr:cyclin-J18 [Mercurialis annua]XP_055961658.1 cyclin-J18 [Mercurialis annua]